MTQEEYNKFAERLMAKGYRKYPSPRYSNNDYAWFKSFERGKYEEDRSGYQMCFDVFDFSEYSHQDAFFKKQPISIEPLVFVSRTINERIDLHLSFISIDDENIEALESLADSFFKWVESNIEIPNK